MTAPASDSVLITLSDQTGLQPAVATAWVAGWINGGSNSFQVLQPNGTFGDPTVRSVAVQANQPWQPTGVTIAQGSTMTMTVTYTSGTWTADPHTNGGQLYDAKGCPGLDVPTSQTAYPIVGALMGALVGRIGDGAPFLIGDSPQIITSASGGDLELCINDDLTGAYGAGLTDNSGSVTVQIAQGLSFYAVSSVPSVTLSTTTSGNDRLLFVVAPSQPAQLPIANAAPMEYTAYPYANPPGVAAPGLSMSSSSASTPRPTSPP